MIHRVIEELLKLFHFDGILTDVYILIIRTFYIQRFFWDSYFFLRFSQSSLLNIRQNGESEKTWLINQLFGYARLWPVPSQFDFFEQPFYRHTVLIL